jgi:RNA polymerase sigma factor (sigma-70 family)
MPSISNTLVSPPLHASRLNALIKRYSSPIGLLLERQRVARGDVDDARQRVWLTAARCIERIQPGSERAFLLSVARREAGHTRRSRHRRSEVLGTEFDELPGGGVPCDELLERRQLLEQASAVLEEMDKGLSTILWMSEVDEATAREIAELLQIPVGTAKSRLRRARTDCARRVAARTTAPSGGRP